MLQFCEKLVERSRDAQYIANLLYESVTGQIAVMPVVVRVFQTAQSVKNTNTNNSL